MAPTRFIKLLPTHVGVTENFMPAFMNEWAKNRDKGQYKALTPLLQGDVYSGDLDTLYAAVRTDLPYMSATFFMDMLFRYPFVKRDLTVKNGKVDVQVIFDITRDYAWKIIPIDVDLLGFKNN